MTTYEIRTLGGEVIHEVEVGDRKIAYPPDLHGLDFTNANLRWADLQGVNLEGAILLGANLAESNLQRANLKNVDARYCDFTKADLREANLENIDVYPSQFFKTHFWGAQMTPGSDIADCYRISREETNRRLRIRPGSVAWKKLERINGWTSTPAPSLTDDSFSIVLDRGSNTSEKEARDTLRHEMCHVSTWGEEPSHGPRWQACMAGKTE
jgi:Pentapeptide repeats (8 copies)/SprT-like family